MNEQGAAALAAPADPAIGHRLVFVGVGLTPGARTSLEDAAAAAGGRVVLVDDAATLATVLPQVVEAAPLAYSGVPTIPGRAGSPAPLLTGVLLLNAVLLGAILWLRARQRRPPGPRRHAARAERS